VKFENTNMYLRLEENTKERKKTQEKWGIYRIVGISKCSRETTYTYVLDYKRWRCHIFN
jgi:hypothetical protein